jgi:hypothetical protein
VHLQHPPFDQVNLEIKLFLNSLKKPVGKNRNDLLGGYSIMKPIWLRSIPCLNLSLQKPQWGKHEISHLLVSLSH